MAVKLITPPASEPVSVSEAKLHLRVDGTDEDMLISGLITAARQHVEDYTQRALITQTWRLLLDEFPHSDTIHIPMPPLQTVNSITYYDATGALQNLPATDYHVDSESLQGRVVLTQGKCWPATQPRPNAVTIEFVVGYGDATAVPQAIKHAILMLVAHWYEHREAVAIGTSGNVATEVAFAVDALLTPYRVWRFV